MRKLKITERKSLIDLAERIQTILKLDSMNLDFEFGYRFNVSTSVDGSHHEITLYDKSEFNKTYLRQVMDNQHFGLSNYFADLGIPLGFHFDAFYLFSILHEFGHVDQFTLFKIPYHPYMISDATGMMLKGTKSSLNLVTRYQNLYSELYADKFAYRWFPIIWNKFNKEITEIIE